MPARTGEQFLRGLKSPRDIWVDGGWVADVVDHPALGGAARALAAVYDLQHEAADICLMPTIDRMADLGLKAMWEDAHPNVTGWYDRFAARDAFARTYYAGTRLTEIFDSSG